MYDVLFPLERNIWRCWCLGTYIQHEWVLSKCSMHLRGLPCNIGACLTQSLLNTWPYSYWSKIRTKVLLSGMKIAIRLSQMSIRKRVQKKSQQVLWEWKFLCTFVVFFETCPVGVCPDNGGWCWSQLVRRRSRTGGRWFNSIHHPWKKKLQQVLWEWKFLRTFASVLWNKGSGPFYMVIDQSIVIPWWCSWQTMSKPRK